MPGPGKKATLDLLVRHLLFSSSVAEAVETTKDLGGNLKDWMQQSLGLISEVQDKEFEIVRKRALLNYLNVQLDELILSLGAEARAADRRNPQSHIGDRLFSKKAPHQIAKPSGVGLGTELDDCRMLIQAASSLPEQADLQNLKSLIGNLETMVGSTDQALAGLKAAMSQHRIARLRIPEFRDQVRQQFDAFQGELLKRFPGRRDFIESFFLPADLQKPQPETEAPQP